MLCGKVLMQYLKRYCITICYGETLEANFAVGNAKIPSDFNFFQQVVFCGGANFDIAWLIRGFISFL